MIHPDNIKPGSEYERAVTIENAMRLLVTSVEPHIWRWAMARVINSYGYRIVDDMGIANFERQMREVTGLIDNARNKLMVTPSYHLSTVDPSNITPAGNP